MLVCIIITITSTILLVQTYVKVAIAPTLHLCMCSGNLPVQCLSESLWRVIDVMSQVAYVPNIVDDLSQKQDAK